ncbi:unnamed protein product [Linum trigynum]|uniref:Uncharacterized protein n=1 Tax=Linum trigynum TaxID=586398 RepID=A0AAV2G7T8_9ROSI
MCRMTHSFEDNGWFLLVPNEMAYPPNWTFLPLSVYGVDRTNHSWKATLCSMMKEATSIIYSWCTQVLSTINVGYTQATIRCSQPFDKTHPKSLPSIHRLACGTQ